MLLDKAEKLISQEQYQKALPIYQCVVHEMVPVLQEADDSNGAIGDTIERGFEGLSVCARTSAGESYRQEMFDYLFDEFDDKRYEGWSDWKWDFLEMAAEMVSTPQEQKRLFEKTDQFLKERSKGDDWFRYDEEKVLNIKLTVVRRCGSPEEADGFLNKNLNHPSMRRQAIEFAFERKNYERVKILAEDGIALDKQGNLRGLISGWTDWLLKAAQARRNPAEIKQYALALFLDSGRDDYYKCYKKCFSGQEWGQEAQRVIGILKKSRDHRGNASLPQVYIWEQRWQDLFDVVHQNSSAHMLSAYGGHLSSHFPKELVEVYEKVIVSELAPLVGRSHYQDLCRFLRQMKKLDTQGRVKTLIEELSVKYANRPAMLEEMKRI